MTLNEIKTELKKLDRIAFQLPNGEYVAPHFHVTEIAQIKKDFIDCGGKIPSVRIIKTKAQGSEKKKNRGQISH